ncbi:unnamed protein product [Durusdinium trenchii]|uniref:Uncharacterized protein n=1 Tax=Durusdinium trenchii TaxID=1381693 RepID=A0ABP0J261_9DINO
MDTEIDKEMNKDIEELLQHTLEHIIELGTQKETRRRMKQRLHRRLDLLVKGDRELYNKALARFHYMLEDAKKAAGRQNASRKPRDERMIHRMHSVPASRSHQQYAYDSQTWGVYCPPAPVYHQGSMSSPPLMWGPSIWEPSMQALSRPALDHTFYEKDLTRFDGWSGAPTWQTESFAEGPVQMSVCEAALQAAKEPEPGKRDFLPDQIPVDEDVQIKWKSAADWLDAGLAMRGFQ